MPRQDLEEWTDALFLGKFGLGKRKTFGCPSYYKQKKMLAFLFEDGLCVKVLPETFEEKLAKDPDMYQPFSPMGKPMKNWLLIVRPEAAEYEEEMALIEESCAALH